MTTPDEYRALLAAFLRERRASSQELNRYWTAQHSRIWHIWIRMFGGAVAIAAALFFLTPFPVWTLIHLALLMVGGPFLFGFRGHLNRSNPDLAGALKDGAECLFTIWLAIIFVGVVVLIFNFDAILHGVSP